MIVPSYSFASERYACPVPELRLDIPIDMFIRVLVRAVTATSPFLSIIKLSPERSMWSSGSDGCVRQAVPSAHLTAIPLPSPSIRSMEPSGIAVLKTSAVTGPIISENDPPALRLYFFRRML